MSSYKRPFQYPHHAQQDERPWLRYPGPEKASIHSRSFHPSAHKSSGSSDPIVPRAPHTTSPHSNHHHHRLHGSGPGLRHKRSSSRLGGSVSNSSNASLPMSFASSNSSCDSLGHPHASQSPLQRASSQSLVRPRTLADELSFSLQPAPLDADDTLVLDDPSTATTSTHPTTTTSHTSHSHTTTSKIYHSPITPSDLLGISVPTPSTPSSPADSPLSKPAPALKSRPSLLSINTSIANSSALDAAFTFRQSTVSSPTSARGSDGLASPLHLASSSGQHTPRLSSSVSNSSNSNVSSPSSATAPCSALCNHHLQYPPKGYSHSHHHPGCSQHRPERPHRHQHRPGCHHHSTKRHGSRSDRAIAKGLQRYGAPQFVPEHEDDDDDMGTQQHPVGDSALKDTMLSPLEPEDVEVDPKHSTAVTIVGSTPAFGISAFRNQHGMGQDDDEAALYPSGPPKKRQRSAAAVLLGAAVETVIFTGAVALSAYQLLTGRGRQQLDASLASAARITDTPDDSTTKAIAPAAPQGDGSDPVLMITAPVNIPTRTVRHHRDSGLLGKSLHHNLHSHHRNSHSSKSSSRHHNHNKGGLSSSLRSRGHGLSVSLPHAYTYAADDHPMNGGTMVLPDRPNTGTEDDDPQFLRMEAQLTNLIAEGKRALSSRISEWGDA